MSAQILEVIDIGLDLDALPPICFRILLVEGELGARFTELNLLEAARRDETIRDLVGERCPWTNMWGTTDRAKTAALL